MSDKVTVSAKISRELLKEAKERKVDISATIRKSLEETINQKKLDELMILMREIQPWLKKVGKDGWINSIRENRDSR
ncbi:MAG: type II toxin-antitoxin system CcdA family antitoxin [Candidatus Thermoplasmatota archaeon]|jgi:nickel-dependent lactate racemase|nr:type II toxin-antitoxin system CcdA family antitoxin [Candidatus Thermoplasmatota archaeon]MCL5799844.1 type II toxin-antitoxin system CcdA family antitoxin [Candidatus Thermoplasmatota archaeon]